MSNQENDRCLIAVHLWDWTVPTTVRNQEELLDKFVSERMCNAVCVWPDHQPGVFELPIESLKKHNLSTVVYFYTEDVYNWMQSLAWSGGKQDQLEAYVDHWADAIAELSSEMPGKVWWSMGHEHFDQSIGHTSASDPDHGIMAARQFTSKQEAYDFYKQWVLTDLHKIHWSNGHIRQAQKDRVYKYGVDKDIPHLKYALGHDIGVPSTIPYLKQRGMDPNDLFFGAGGTVAASAAYLYSLGPEFKFFWWECSYVGTGLQPGIAFVRGAAKQYGRKWLMDHSPYSSRETSTYSGAIGRDLDNMGLNAKLLVKGPDDPASGADQGLGTKAAVYDDKDVIERRFWWPQHDKDGNRLSGLSWQMIQRDWLWGYMSGADCVFQEAAPITHFIKVGDEETGELRVTPYGEAAKQFYAFAADRCPDRGQTVAPVALLMDFLHGLDPALPPNWSVPFRNNGNFTWGTVPFNSGDHMANLFFDAAFPGQATWPDKPVPWKSSEEYARMLRCGLDERPYERKTVTSSTWGDIFDVVLNNADPSIIDNYEAIVVLGDITLSDEWLSKLKSFAEAGGMVLLNAAQVPVDLWPEWLGCTTEGSRSMAVEADTGCSYEMVDVNPDAAQMLLASDDKRPLVLVNQIGKGEVWLTTPVYMVCEQPDTDNATQLCEAGHVALNAFIGPLAPIEIKGKPLGWVVNQRSNGDRLITLYNPDPEQWIGYIRVPGAAASDGRTRDIWNERAVVHEASGEDLLIHLVIPPWDLIVIEVRA